MKLLLLQSPVKFLRWYIKDFYTWFPYLLFVIYLAGNRVVYRAHNKAYLSTLALGASSSQTFGNLQQPKPKLLAYKVKPD